MSKPMIYYFGAWSKEEKGHYWWQREGNAPNTQRLRIPGGKPSPSFPWMFFDGGLCPNDKTNGVIAVHKQEDWTALAFWDTSADPRPGSNSLFTLKSEKIVQLPLMTTITLVTQEAQRVWPEVFKRITDAGIVLR